jgi:outer membrane usher protein
MRGARSGRHLSKRNRRISRVLAFMLLMVAAGFATVMLKGAPEPRDDVVIRVQVRPPPLIADLRLGLPEDDTERERTPEFAPIALRGSNGPDIFSAASETILTSEAARTRIPVERLASAAPPPALRPSVTPSGPRARPRAPPRGPARTQLSQVPSQDGRENVARAQAPDNGGPMHQPLDSAQSPAEVAVPTPLQLEVTINGQPSQQIGAFVQLPDGQIAATRGELSALGIKVPDGSPEELLRLADIPQLEYNYDAPRQSIAISLMNVQLLPEILNLRPNVEYRAPQRTTGAFLNYTAFLSGAYGSGKSGVVNGGSLNLDGHLFSRFGTFSQSAIVGTTSFDNATILRLDTYWSYSNPETTMSSRAGDLITGGLAWTRPVRIGGVQTRRNFSLRPDLITLPLPSVSGSAAVPSTLDVYLGQVKAYSAELPSGPYRLDNIPVVSGGTTARVVVTDSTGRQVQSETPLFTDIRLLRKGLLDYSIEAGFQRLDYGVRSSDYEDAPVMTASIRRGLTDQITLEGHTELGRGLWNAGAGLSFSAGGLGLLSGATSLSNHGADSGALFYGAWDLPNGNFNLHASTQRTIGDYRDLASLPLRGIDPALSGAGFPRAIDQITAGYRFPDSQSSVSFGAVHADQGVTGKSMLLTTSFTRSFNNGMSLFANAYHDLDNKDSTGAFVGISIPLGRSLSSFAGVTQNNQGVSFSADIAKTIGTEPGSAGGRLAISQGQTSYVSAYGALRLNRGFLEGSVTQQSDTVNAYATFSGALVAAGNGVFASQRIDDAFAVVNAGAPGVKVLRENQSVGVTDSTGKLLVTGLNSYQPYKLSIDALDLPVNADVPKTELYVVPAERSGVVASFGIQKSLPSAEVIFVGADGSFIAPGSHGTLMGAAEPFVVGYDGRAFIKNLGPQNTVAIDLETAACTAGFAFVERADTLVTIGPVTCQ